MWRSTRRHRAGVVDESSPGGHYLRETSNSLSRIVGMGFRLAMGLAAALQMPIPGAPPHPVEAHTPVDYFSLLFVFMLATFIGLGVIARVSRLLHTPLMSLTNAISAIAVVGAIIVAGAEDHPWYIRILGAV